MHLLSLVSVCTFIKFYNAVAREYWFYCNFLCYSVCLLCLFLLLQKENYYFYFTLYFTSLYFNLLLFLSVSRITFIKSLRKSCVWKKMYIKIIFLSQKINLLGNSLPTWIPTKLSKKFSHEINCTDGFKSNILNSWSLSTIRIQSISFKFIWNLHVTHREKIPNVTYNWERFHYRSESASYIISIINLLLLSGYFCFII